MLTLPNNPPDFRFDSVLHEYWLGSRQVRGVSRILEASGLKPPFFGRGQALSLGTEVHRLTELLDRGEADDYEFDPRVEAYRPGWMAFRAAVPFDILEIEQPRYEPTFDFAGTPDRVVTWKRRRTIIEVKTGQVYDWHPLQTASYAKLAGATARLIVYLDPGLPLGFRMQQHKESADWQRFAGALAVTGADALEKGREA